MAWLCDPLRWRSWTILILMLSLVILHQEMLVDISLRRIEGLLYMELLEFGSYSGNHNSHHHYNSFMFLLF